MHTSNLRRLALLSSAAVLGLSVSACGGGGGSGGDPVVTDAGDTKSPAVTLSPADGATGVARNVVITATFNEDILNTSIDSGSVTLTDDSDVAGTVAFDEINNIVTFTPTNELARISEHTVNISGNITDLSGNALVADSMTFTTRDGVWGDAALLDNSAENMGGGPESLAFDADGNAIVTWIQVLNSRSSVYASHYVKGTGWGAPLLVETDDTGHASTSQVAMNDDGEAIIVWNHHDGTRHNIWVSHYSSASWSNPELIETDNAGTALNHQISMDNAGNALVVWNQHDGTRYNIMANRYSAGGSWAVATVIDTEELGHAEYPQIAMDASGNALVVWSQHDSIRTNIWANRFNSGSTSWEGAALIETDDDGAADQPMITMNRSGNAVVIWSQQTATFIRNVTARPYIAGTGWGVVEIIENSDVPIPRDLNVAIDPSGNALAVWQQSHNEKESIYSNYYTAGTGWSSAELIESNDVDASYGDPVQIAMDARGNGIATWSMEDFVDGNYNNILINRYVAGIGWTGETIAQDNTGTFDYAETPNISIDESGNGILTFQQPTVSGGVKSLWVKHFD
ncbi:MAG: Ig-like domain-containing protein [Candidatus Polarisedimenticolaceae bacterium]|nr:Ig-like domain-containing protein [Candidatus Polarisedimenticolaceae bacterium]